jgi:hypothetical protein
LGELLLFEADGLEIGEELAAEGVVFLAVFPGHEDGLAGEPMAQGVKGAGVLVEIVFAADLRFGGQLVQGREREIFTGFRFALMLFDEEFLEPIFAREGVDLF